MSHPDLLSGERAKTVGVLPPAAFYARPRLWRALEEAFPVNFVPRDRDQLGGLDAVIAHDIDLPAEPALPALQTSSADALEGYARISLARTNKLPACLQGWVLGDGRSLELPALQPRAGETVLASRGGAPVWVAGAERAMRQRCAAFPEELAAQEPLRARLRAGRFLALLPLLALLRALTEATRWTTPPLQATFMFDDPNLHWTSYGYLDFADLAARAAGGRFHVACATVPFDAWYSSRRAAQLFQKAELSLLIHGNNHAWCELGRVTGERRALALVAQALARVQALERRTGVAVARVMAPPHGACAPATFQALRRSGFLAACISRPYPWRERAPVDRPLAQWSIADVVCGLPVLSRYSLTKSSEDIPLRSFLNQPLILYGHHQDVSAGPERLEEIAAEVDRMGDAHWRDLAAIARSSFLARRDGELLRVRMYTQEAHVGVPEGVGQIAVEVPVGSDYPTDVSALLTSPTRSATASLSEPVEVRGGEGPVRVRLVCADTVDPVSVQAPCWHAWPPARRLLAEGRDRLTPGLHSIPDRVRPRDRRSRTRHPSPGPPDGEARRVAGLRPTPGSG